MHYLETKFNFKSCLRYIGNPGTSGYREVEYQICVNILLKQIELIPVARVALSVLIHLTFKFENDLVYLGRVLCKKMIK